MMPCYDDRDNINQDGVTITRLLIRCDELATLLCLTGQCYYAKKDMPNNVTEYWEQHCEFDKKRGEPWEVEP